MLIKLTSQNCAFFVKSRKILLIFLFFPPRLVWHHSSTTFPQQDDFRQPRGQGCSLATATPGSEAVGSWSRSCQGGLAEPWPAADEEVWKAGDLEGVLHLHSQVMETGDTCGEWPGQAGAGVALLIPLSEVEPRGCRGCRPWELQLGGPTEEERMREVFYCVPVQCCLLCIQIRAAHSHIK